MNERIDQIQFGDLKLIQNQDWFCYGIDAVLLADFAEVKEKDMVADLGTGGGIVPLIVNHKGNPCGTIGIEVQNEVAELAKRNVLLNGLEEKISIIHANVTELDDVLDKGTFDVVVSNPPYAKKDQGIKNSNTHKTIARHEIHGTLDDFVKAAADLLKPHGQFCMVHRPSRLVDILSSCRNHRLEPKEIQFVYPKESSKEPNILLIRCKKFGGVELKYKEPLYVYKEDGQYTDKILAIYEKNRGQ